MFPSASARAVMQAIENIQKIELKRSIN